MCIRRYNLKVFNIRNLPTKYASYKNSFIDFKKLQELEKSILMR